MMGTDNLGIRYDQGKARFDLIPPLALYELAKVYSYGATKYTTDNASGERNWEKGLSWGKTIAASLRHITKWMGGEVVDDESNLHHLAHATFGLFALIEMQASGKGVDDRSTLHFASDFDWSTCRGQKAVTCETQ